MLLPWRDGVDAGARRQLAAFTAAQRPQQSPESPVDGVEREKTGSGISAEGSAVLASVPVDARTPLGARKRLRAKTPGNVVGTEPPKKSARTDTQIAIPADRGDVEPPAKAARIDSLRAAQAAAASGSATLLSGVDALSAAGTDDGDMKRQAAAAAEARRKPEWARGIRVKTTPDRVERALDDAQSPGPGESPRPASCPGPPTSRVASDASQKAADAATERRRADKARGLGPEAAARLEQASRGRPASTAANGDDWFGAGAADKLRRTLGKRLPASGAAASSSASAATPPEPATTTATGASRTGPETPSQMEPDSAMTPPPGHMTSAAPPSPAAAVPESSAPPPRKCSRWRHICAEHPILGCSSYDKMCRRDYSDLLCPFYGEERVDHPDAALGDTVDHISQTQFVLSMDGVQLPSGPRRAPGWYEGHRLVISVDNMRFELGAASGDGCNCLIDTLRQLLNALGGVLIPQSCVAEVRGLLEDKHRHGATPIISRDYLDLALYWEDVVNLLWEQDRLKERLARRADLFEIICVDLMWVGNGDRLPHQADRSRRQGLYVARVNGNHFVPLRRFLDGRVVRPVPPARTGSGGPAIAALSAAAL